MRWKGFLTPADSGSYRIGVAGAMNRLWLDGKLIVEDLTLHMPTATTATVSLEKGHRYALTLEYTRGGAGAKLVWLPLIPEVISQAVSAAQHADVVVAVVGITSDLEGEEMRNVDRPGFKGGDRTSLDLPQEEEDLLRALQGTGKPLVVVLMNGSALSVNWANEHANAILDAWYAGEEGGAAIAQTLAGVNNPAGRLQVTFYRGIEQLPPFEDYSMSNRTYRYFEGQPLYPFGHGLSYSQFEYRNLKLSAAKLRAGEALGVEVEVKNTSRRDGDEVVQLYLSFPKSPGAPRRALRGFTRIHLGAGQAQHVKFTVQARDLSHVSEAGDRIVAAGAYSVSVGGGQPGTAAPGATARFTIRGEQKLPD